ncbi:hypothetical protein GH808_14740 [Acetobacterium fimetarium]|uniref:DUF4177 domain-containing protein n=1 Tax=Acetobacterium fimetarium TaxID=52691 RepID=A0ABR6WYM6_9FIRM|nr:hypothetical protein [Acetobacterium fimetarium]MBC3805665.1 hypothetical protein [Acetobacterium fimetarium]
MKKYICVSIGDKVKAEGNDFNKGFRKCNKEELSKEIEDVCNDYDEKGYDVVSIVPIVQGQHMFVSNDGVWSNSTTEGVIITFKAK